MFMIIGHEHNPDIRNINKILYDWTLRNTLEYKWVDMPH